MQPNRPFRKVLIWATSFEASLGILGWALALLAGIPLASRLSYSLTIFGWGLIETLPLTLLLWLATKSRWEVSRKLIRTLRRTLGNLFSSIGLPGIIALSAAAGIGEEVLFRGFLQPFLGKYVPVWASVALAGIAFGAVHWISAAYAATAAVVGIYLGALAEIHGTIVVPITVHAVYDVVAIWFVIHGPGSETPDLHDGESEGTFSPT